LDNTHADGVTAAVDRVFCRDMLPRVSRTFAICIRLLPPELEHSVLVAYLLCRVADTIEDTTRLSPGDRHRLLAHFSVCLDEDGPDAGPLSVTFADAAADDELLAREADKVLRQFRLLPEAQRSAVRPWVKEMCSGMAEFTRVAPGETRVGSSSIGTIQDLERYCYYVAGTVGHLLTELFAQQSAVTRQRYARMKSLATSFGLGLQLTNIIKDVADDRRRGRSYVPRQLCLSVGITPEQVQAEDRVRESRQVLDQLIDKAKGHLCDALEYSTALPRRLFRVRAFCLTSFYFAVRTLRLAERDPRLLDPDRKLKISRAEVYRTVAATKLIAPADSLVRRYFRSLAGEAWWQRYLSHRTTAQETL
jgi:farnesyl-diphosphate farnesyltransferase